MLTTAFFEAVSALLLFAALGSAAYGMAAWLLPGGSTARRWSAAVIVGQWFQILVFQILAGFNAFRLPTVCLVTALAAMAVSCLRVLRPRGGTSLAALLAADCGNLWTRADHALAGPARRLFLFGLAAAGVVVIRGMINIPTSYTSILYHGITSGNYVREGGWFELDTAGPWGFQYRFYATAGEMMLAWLMLPFHSEFLVGLSSLPSWGLAMASLYELGRSLGLPPCRAAIPAGIIGFMPAVFAFIATNNVDVPLLAVLLGGTLFFLEAWERGGWPAYFLCGAAFGTALAIKIFGLAGAVAVSAMLLLRCFRSNAPMQSLKYWLVAVITLLSVGIQHYLRLWIHHGSPTWPMPLNLLGMPLFAGSPDWKIFLDQISNATDLMMSGTNLTGQIIYLMGWYFGFSPMSFGPVGAVLGLTAPVGLAILWNRGHRGFCGFLIMMLAGSSVGLFGAGMWKFHLHYASINARLISIIMAIIVLLGTVSFERWRSEARFVVYTLLLLMSAAALAWAFPQNFSTGFPLLDLILLGLPVIALFLPVRHMPAIPDFNGKNVAKAVVLTVGALTILPAVKGELRPRQLMAAYEANGPSRNIAPAWITCDDPAVPRRIAFSAGWGEREGYVWFWAPLLGRRLQNHLAYVPITKDGDIMEYYDPDLIAQKADFDSWDRRLREQRIDTVVLFPPFPPEYDWVISRPDRFRPEGTASPAMVFRVEAGNR